MASEQSFTWGSLAFRVEEFMRHFGIDPHFAIDLLVASSTLVLIAFFAGQKYRRQTMVEPSNKLSFSKAVELAVTKLYFFAKDFLGKSTDQLFVLVGGLFFFILFNNLIGSIPGFNPPTDQLNTTIVLGILVFLTTHILGIRRHGFGYIKHFTGPVWWLSWLLFPVELISHFVRPLSLGLRLFGNMTGDHKVVGVFFGILPLVLPIPFLGVGIFIAILQAFVFLILTLVYLSGAIEQAH